MMIMELQIMKEEHKPLLGRKDVTARVAYESVTPKRDDIRKDIAHKTKSKEELVIISSIQPDYGKQSAMVDAKVYDDEQTLRKVEPRFSLKKHGFQVEEKKKKGAAAAEGDSKKK
jgi:ribosomal protein S24E